jgi:hypothetical protein
MIRIASHVIPALHKRHTKDVLLLKPSAILSVFQLHIACAMSFNKRATGVMKGKVRCKIVNMLATLQVLADSLSV